MAIMTTITKTDCYIDVTRILASNAGGHTDGYIGGYIDGSM